ncbi:MAG: hypothetical protein IPO08_21840 [Xanthomonadales bacterium]|nr:hypothetical protein [Xanthomonadales bacterium]
MVFFDPADDFAPEGEVFAPADLEDAPREVLAGTFLRVVVAAGRDPDRDVAEEFAAVVEACRSVADLGGVVLVADEVGDYSRRADSHLTRLHRNGHHDGVASVLVSQCATDIPKTCRRTATRCTSLLQVNADDLDALAREYGDDFASNVKGWRPGRPPVVWTLPTLHHPRKERALP